MPASRAIPPPPSLPPAEATARLRGFVEAAWERSPELAGTPARQAAATARAASAGSITPGPPSVGGGFVTDGFNNRRGGREFELSVATPLWLPGEGTASVLEHDIDGSGAAVLAALARLAAAVAAKLVDSGLTIVGVTGSSGKTSTKDLLAAVLTPLGEVIAPPGSFNNELGHPWTVLRADTGTRHLVLELSARGAGHIAALCRIAQPRIGVVLNVGRAHLGEFGSPQAIAQAKGELVEARPPADVVSR